MLQHDGDAGCPVTVLVVATKMEMGAHNMLASLRRYGYPYRVLGWGEPWRGWRQRMTWYRDAAAAFPRDALVLFADAYDIVAARPWAGLVEAYDAVRGDAPIVTGMEAWCLPSNCGRIDGWWAQSARKPASSHAYINGGVILGRAGAIADAYAWILADARGFTDDQVGLAAYVADHPSAFAPDDAGAIVANKHVMERMSGEEAAGDGAYFLHYPGVNKTPALFPIQQAWRAHAGPLAVTQSPGEVAWGRRWWLYTILVPLLILLVGIAVGWAGAVVAAKGAVVTRGGTAWRLAVT